MVGIRLNRKSLSFTLLGVLIALKVVYAAATPFSPDFIAWISFGSLILNGTRYIGVYTGPAYIFAATYYLWLLITGDSTSRQRLIDLFPFTTLKPNVVSFPADLAVFTLFMKIPMLLADFATMYMLKYLTTKLTGSSAKGITSALLWAGSPLVFYAEAESPVEIFPALLILLGVYAIYRSKIKSGSALLAVGAVLRFAPLLFDWIYVVAFLRLRQFKNLLGFLSIQFVFLSAALLSVSFLTGRNPILIISELLGAPPGILGSEILSSLGLFVKPEIGYSPYELGANLIAYIIMAYYLTKRSVWSQRHVGIDALVFLTAYFALTSPFPHFLLWMIPVFIIYAVTTRFGPSRYILTTLLGTAMAAILESKYGTSGGQKSVFFIPTINAQMSSFSAFLYRLDSLVLVPSLIRSMFSASLLLLLFWILREMIQSSRQDHRDVSQQSSVSRSEGEPVTNR